MQMLSRKNLHGHQTKVSKFISDLAANGGCLCILDVGGGKTVSTLDAIKTLREGFCCNKILVVSTKRIVKDVWPAEIGLWEQSSDLSVVTREQILSCRRNRKEPDYLKAKQIVEEFGKVIKFEGSKKVDKLILRQYNAALKAMRHYERKALMQLDGDIFLINVENYRWLVNTFGTGWPFDTVVLDESSLFRNSDSKRFKAAKKVRPFTSTVVELTGTPAPNGYIGLWSQCFLIDGGERLGKTITSYRNKYFNQTRDGFSYELKDGADIQIQKAIKDIVIHLDPKDYMEIGPEPINENYKLQMPDNLVAQYKKLERDYFLEIDGLSVMALSEAVKSNKLRQFCNGAMYSSANDDTDEEEKKQVIDVHDIKIEALKEIVDISVGNPLIVAYEFISERKKIKKAFPKAVLIDDFDQAKWDAGEIDMLLIHPRSGGHGLNLQHGGHRVVWFSTSIDLELYDQLNGRVGQLRQAQSGYFKAPIYYHLYFEGTVESDLIRKRNVKDVTQKDFIYAMKEGIELRQAA